MEVSSASRAFTIYRTKIELALWSKCTIVEIVSNRQKLKVFFDIFVYFELD